MGQGGGGVFLRIGYYPFLIYAKPRSLPALYIRKLLSIGPGPCELPGIYGRTPTCSLLVMQQTRNNKDKDLKGGRHARNEDELYKKAIALLEKCKMSEVLHRTRPV